MLDQNSGNIDISHAISTHL